MNTEELRGMAINFLEKKYKKKIGKAMNENNVVEIDLDTVLMEDEFEKTFKKNPSILINAFQEAVDMITDDIQIALKNIPDRFKINLQEVAKPESIGKFICIEGILSQVSEIGVFSESIDMCCMECQEIETIKLEVGDSIKKKFPCMSCGRVSYHDIAGEKKKNFQIIHLTEPMRVISSNVDIRVLLKNKFIDSFITEKKKLIIGSTVTVWGIVREKKKRKGKNEVNIMDLYIDCYGWKRIEETIEITENDVEEIKKFAKQENVIDELVKNMAISIYGHDNLKESALVCMVSGNDRTMPDGTKRRGNVHVLVIGDPATAKTKLQKAIETNSTKVQYVVGASSTKAGLSASLRFDKDFDAWVIDAGALLLAHNGIVLIDELDKLERKESSILDMTMETQEFYLNKAGINAKFPSNVKVFACANPKFGRFDMFAGDLMKQIEMSETLLSRFDLKFVVLDVVDEERDKKIIKKIMRGHREVGKIDRQFTTKYLIYCSRLRPELTEEAVEMIEEFSMKLRKVNELGGSLKITHRQTESICRISEAFAKMRLSELVEVQDVERAIKLFAESLKSFGIDPETNEVDIDLFEGRKPKTQRDKLTAFDETFRKIEKEKGYVTKSDLVGSLNEPEMEIERIISSMMKEGRIKEETVGRYSSI